MILLLLPLLLVLFVALVATSGMALRSRSRSLVVARELPAAEPWEEQPLVAEEVSVEPASQPVRALVFDAQGNPLSLNDLMYSKLDLHYSANGELSLNDLLFKFRRDNS